MAMVTTLNLLTGPVVSGNPTQTAIGAGTFKYNREDTANGVTPLPIPVSATVTAFSFVKSFQLVVNNANSLTMTSLAVGLTAPLAFTGAVLMMTAAHAYSAYTQATTPPAQDGSHGAGGSTACTINGAAASMMVLYGSATPYAFSVVGFSGTGNAGNLVETVLGVDGTCTATGSATAVTSLTWSWCEA